MHKYIAFVPVRGGSKSIPLKNIKLFNGKPLLYWNLFAASNSNYIDQIIVSTDSPLIRDTVNELNLPKVKVIDRDSKLAEDATSTEAVMLDYSQFEEFENIVLLQVTSPMTTTLDIDQSIIKYETAKYDSLLSVVRSHRFIWNTSKDIVIPTNYDPTKRPRRQEWSGQLVENGAIYITSRANLIDSKSRLSGRIGAYEMSSNSYFEIDEPEDWSILESLHKRVITSNDRKDFEKIKIVISDVDGVLTDGKMHYFGEELEGKSFNAKDGMGFELLAKRGIRTGIISGEDTISIRRRAKKLKLENVYLGIKDKLEVINEICSKYNLKYSNIAYIGDDINDLPVLKTVGLAVCVNDAVDEVKNNSHLILNRKGGDAAFREFVDILLN